MTESAPIRVLVVDDHAAVRSSIVRLFSRYQDLNVTGEAFDGSQVLDMAKQGDFDLVLLDISMPGKNGLDVLRELKHELPQLPVIMLSIHSREEYRSQAMALGASAYVAKDRAAEDLIGVVRRITKRGAPPAV
ncbi:MAG: hypothetical protein AMXMBFR84_14150 [Candidatus Hydrogenedentota bacterium]